MSMDLSSPDFPRIVMRGLELGHGRLDYPRLWDSTIGIHLS